jgi:hypothetical protein
VLASARDEIRVLSITEAGDLSSRSTGLDGRNVLFIRPAVGGPVAERVLKALDEPVKPARADMELMLDDVLGMLQPAKGPRIPYLVQPGVKNVKGIRLMEAELPLGAWLLAVEDLSPDVRFVVREYGVLVTTKDRVPEGAVSLRAFWHGRPDIRPLDKDPLRPGSVPPPPTKP